MAEGAQQPLEPLSFPELLSFDLRGAQTDYDARVAQDRVRSLSQSAMLLLIGHLVTATLVVGSSIESSGLSLRSAAVLLPLLVLFALDIAFYLATTRRLAWDLSPSTLVQGALAYGAAASGTLLWMIEPALAAAHDAPLVDAALGLTFFLHLLAFLRIPILVLETFLFTVIELAMLGFSGGIVSAIGTLSGCLMWFSLVNARDYVIMVGRRLNIEWQAEQAQLFVREFEQSGRGGFWETNAEADLLYISEQLADDIKSFSAELVGRSLWELISEEEEAREDGSDSIRGHFDARRPFSDITVRAAAESEVWWTVSGSPNFDEFGTFLGFRGIATDLTEEKKSAAEINRLARFDSLTGLPNRAVMRKSLDDALRGNGAEASCSLFLIDLDRFKNVNDTLGHPVGDSLLKEVAQRLTAVVGDAGQVGRLGGDEFNAVFPSTNDEKLLAEIAERLIAEVSAPYNIEGHNVSIGASVGIAVADTDRSTSDAMVRDADLALYAAKEAGRGTWRFFEVGMHSEVQDRQVLEHDLRNAIQRGELRVTYQPSVNTVTEEVVGFEALARWNHATRGPISPAVFIPLAEECGLILQIGEWVLRTACAEAAQWPSHVKVAVNLSPIQFAHPSLISVVINALKSADLDPERLELEITEGVFLVDSDSTDEQFSRLEQVGVRLALDDFGTGYSSLGYLRKAPFNKIKIDQSFVRGACSAESRNAAIIRSIVALAESLHMETTAEGAETAEELELIRRLGCSQVQGYIFGKPMEAEEAREIAGRTRNPSADAHNFSRAPRHRLIRKAQIDVDGKQFDVTLRNISTGGALIECFRGFAPGTPMLLSIPGCPVLKAEVRWSQPGRIGVRFDQAFDLAQLAPKKASAVKVLRPDYLNSETAADSPWAGRTERLNADELKRG